MQRVDGDVIWSGDKVFLKWNIKLKSVCPVDCCSLKYQTVAKEVKGKEYNDIKTKRGCHNDLSFS